MSTKQKLVSGITATGSLTIGNYIGAIKNMIEMQNEYDMFIFVADLHALTIEINPQTLSENRKSIFALYLALGLDPNKATIFFQSEVEEHGIMSWLVQTQTTIGDLSRMTQYKDKSSKVKSANGTEFIPTGLLTYPTLMAADILLYNPTKVPVGQDQKQHLELTRNIAEKLNRKYKTDFNIPEFVTPKIGSKIMSLLSPDKKMSKSSDNPKETIYLLDDPNKAYKKIMSAITDSENKVYLSDEKPGIKNLLTIYASLNNIELETAEAKFKDANYAEFKGAVATSVKSFLESIQQKYQTSLASVEELAKMGAEKARKEARINLLKLMKGIGLK